MMADSDEENPLCSRSPHPLNSHLRPPFHPSPFKNFSILLLGFCLGILAFWITTITRASLFVLQTQHQNPPPSHPLNFLVVGDWGRQGLYNQSQVAIQMGRIGQQLGIDFVVSVGDNFYDKGLKDVDDPHFSASFTNVYTAPSLQTTWYTVLGNHDYMGDTVSQLSDHLVKRDPRWFCRREFQLHLSLCKAVIPGKSCNASVDMFFFDTTPFINEYWEANGTSTFNWTGLAPDRKEQRSSQLQNLARELAKSKAPWKVVFGHHTIRSIGHHGDLQELINLLLPLLERHEVDVYINGHDHNLQHLKRADSRIHFFTSGGGSKAFSGLRPYDEEAGVQFAFDGQGFLAVSMNATVVSFSFYDVFGDVLYSYTLEK